MKTEEFNTLLNSLINGMPAPVVINRLMMALRDAIESGGADAEKSFRDFVETTNVADAEDDIDGII